MTSSQTVVAFGVYVVFAALILLFAPGLLFALLLSPPPGDPYYIVLGIIALGIGYYYLRLGRAGSQAFVQATVIGRLAVAIGLGVAVGLGALPMGLLIFALVELLGALWTGLALRREGLAALTF